MSGIDFEVLIKYLSGQADPEEALRIEDWRNASVNNAQFLNELFHSWNHETPYLKPDVDQLWKAFQEALPEDNSPTEFNSRKPKRISWIQYAAIVVVGVSLGIYFFNNTRKQPVTYTGDVDSIEYILSDQSIVILNKGSQLQYSIQNKKRELLFSGVGFFEINNHEIPLYILLKSGLKIEDIGTSFWIEEAEKNVTVSVLEGRIRATFAAEHKEAGKNEILTFDLSNKTFTLHKRTGNFAFQDISLKEICNHLSRYFNTSIQLSESLDKEIMSLNGNDLNFEASLDIITATFELKKETLNNGDIRIYK